MFVSLKKYINKNGMIYIKFSCFLWRFGPNFDGTILKCSINVPSKLEGCKKYNPRKYLTYRDLYLGVPGGTRTHDIQNHNLTL